MQFNIIFAANNKYKNDEKIFFIFPVGECDRTL